MANLEESRRTGRSSDEGGEDYKYSNLSFREGPTVVDPVPKPEFKKLGRMDSY